MKTYELFLITLAIGNLVIPIFMIIKSKHLNRKQKIKRMFFTLIFMGIISGFILFWILKRHSFRGAF